MKKILVAMFLAIAGGCASFSRPSGCYLVPSGVSKVTRYGIEVKVPSVPGVGYMHGAVQPASYLTPFGVVFSWPRESAFHVGLSVDFPPNRFRDGMYPAMTREYVASFVRSRRTSERLEIVAVDVIEDRSIAPGGFRFKLTCRRTNKGNMGMLLVEEGCLFVHPFDPERLVVILAADAFYPSRGQSPDETLRQQAVRFFEGALVKSPSDSEKAYMRSKGNWVELGGEIPR